MDRPAETNPTVQEIECEVCHKAKSPEVAINSVCQVCHVAVCDACLKESFDAKHDSDDTKTRGHYPYFCLGLITHCRNCLNNLKKIHTEERKRLLVKIDPDDLRYYPTEEIEGEPDFGCSHCGVTSWHGDFFAIGHYKCDICHYGLCRGCYSAEKVSDVHDDDNKRTIATSFFHRIFDRCVKCCLKEGFPEGKSANDVLIARAQRAIARSEGKYRHEDVPDADYVCEECDEEIDENRHCPNCDKALCDACNPDFEVYKCRATIKDGKKRAFGKRGKKCGAPFACSECLDEGEGWKCVEHAE